MNKLFETLTMATIGSMLVTDGGQFEQHVANIV